MSIRISDIIRNLARDVYTAHQSIEKEKLNIGMPEVEITLNLEAELEGKPVTTTIKEEKEQEGEKVEETDGVPITRYVMDEKTLRDSGISFRTIATVHPRCGYQANVTLRVVFILDGM